MNVYSNSSVSRELSHFGYTIKSLQCWQLHPMQRSVHRLTEMRGLENSKARTVTLAEL